MADAEDDRPEDIDEPGRFVRWARDPSDQLFCVQGVRAFGVVGPMSLVSERGGRLVSLLLGMINKPLVRVQSSQSFEGCHLEVIRVSDDEEETVLDNTMDDWEKGREHADRLVASIRAGTFAT